MSSPLAAMRRPTFKGAGGEETEGMGCEGMGRWREQRGS